VTLPDLSAVGLELVETHVKATEEDSDASATPSEPAQRSRRRRRPRPESVVTVEEPLIMVETKAISAESAPATPEPTAPSAPHTPQDEQSESLALAETQTPPQNEKLTT
jgi:hypothetical protein